MRNLLIAQHICAPSILCSTREGCEKMNERTHKILARKVLTFGLCLLLALTMFVGMAYQSNATDLDHGWAIIVGPGNSNSVHTQESKDLRDYLLEKGWDDEHIIYLDYGGQMYIDGDPTKANFEDAIDTVDRVSTPDDVVFIAVMDHGVDGGDNDYYLRFGKKLDEYISDTAFATLLDSIDNYRAMVVDIAGSFSGGFIDAASNGDRIIITDCDVDEFYKKSEYSFCEALTDIDADMDFDGMVSVEEAHAYMVASMYNTVPQLDDPDPNEDFVLPEY